MDENEKRLKTEGVTIVFDFDIRLFSGNPYLVDTPFGRAKVIARGDIIEERDELESDIEAVKEAYRPDY